MTTSQEFVMTLFNKDTIEKVKRLFYDSKEQIGFNSYEMSFRLFKPTRSNINLELPANFITSAGKEPHKIAFGKIEKMIMFSKPIGYYTKSNVTSLSDVIINIPNEFQGDYEYLKSQGLISQKQQVNLLSLVENAVLAAFSIEALDKALLYEDAKFRSNGLRCEIFLTYEGYPQVFLDDIYNLQGPIAAYMLKEQKTINPMINYKSLFDKFSTMSLLTAFKRL